MAAAQAFSHLNAGARSEEGVAAGRGRAAACEVRLRGRALTYVRATHGRATDWRATHVRAAYPMLRITLTAAYRPATRSRGTVRGG